LRVVTAFACIATLAFSAGAPRAETVPVMVGGDADYDACGTLGVVTGLDPYGDNFLSLRAGPGGGGTEILRLDTGAEVIICDERGSWYGVVYPPSGSDCGVSSPIVQRAAYRGPCKSGWVAKRYVEVIAG
jgi:hypothetical protein